MISLTWTGAAENAVPPSRSCVKKGAASQHGKQSTLKSTIDIDVVILLFRELRKKLNMYEPGKGEEGED